MLFRSTESPTQVLARRSPERIARFQALEPGRYWRALSRFEMQGSKSVDVSEPVEGEETSDDVIQRGMVLLLVDVELHDNEPHTVSILEHPSVGTGKFKMLVDDFLARFEFAPDGEEVREQEVSTIQSRVAALQQDLSKKQRDPGRLRGEIAEDLAEWEQRQRKDELREAAQNKLLKPTASSQADEARAMTVVGAPGGALNADLATALESRVDTKQVTAMQRYLTREGQAAALIAKVITRDMKQIQRVMEEVTPYVEEKAAVAMAKLAAAQRYTEQLLAGIQSLDLYTGKGVEVETLREGESAAYDEPLTLFQRKLFADEELAAHADVGPNWDFSSHEDFDKELVSNPA